MQGGGKALTTKAAVLADSDALPERKHASLFSAFLTIYISALVLCALDLSDGQMFYYDVDNFLREIQIRHLLSSAGRWWDITLPMIGSPEPYVSPWSRLVDLPYVLIVSVLEPFVGHEAAIADAFLVWPPLMLGIYSLLVAMMFVRLSPLRGLFDYLLLVTATFTMVFAVWEFTPGRIDHHNMQIVALMTMLAGVMRWDRAGGLMIGTGAVISVVIALEGLPFVVFCFAGVAVAFILGSRMAGVMLKAAAVAILVLTPVLALLLLGPAGAVSTQCDAFSAPYITLLIGCAAILLAVCSLYASGAAWKKVALLLVPALVLLAVCAIAFPQCREGPYWMIDPLTKHFWFDRIPQERSVIDPTTDMPIAHLLLIALAAGTILAAAPVAIARLRSGKPAQAIVLFVALTSFILTVAFIRYIRFPFAFTPVFLPAAYYWLRDGGGVAGAGRSAKRLVIVASLCIFAGLLSTRLFALPERTKFDAVDMMSLDDCGRGDLTIPVGTPPGHILAPDGLGLSLVRSHLPEGFSAGPVPFHRASPGMRRAFEAFLSTDPAVRKNALAPFDYVAVCRIELTAETGVAPLYDALSAGKGWPGLIRVEGNEAANAFQLFRIDHAELK